MDRKRWFAATSVVAAFLGTGASAAAVVEAAGEDRVKVTTQSRGVTVAPYRAGLARAPDCRGDLVNTGTGFDLGAYDRSGALARGRLAALLEGALITVNTGGSPQQARVERYCTSHFRGQRRPRAETQLTPGESGRATRSCDRGFEAVQAGFEARDRDDPSDEAVAALRVESLLLRKRGVRRRAVVEATNTSADREFRLYVYVHCFRRGPRLSVRQATAQVPSSGETSVRARCPRGRIAIGGGFSGSPGTYALSALKQRRRSFVVRAVHAGPGTGQLTAFAHCVQR